MWEMQSMPPCPHLLPYRSYPPLRPHRQGRHDWRAPQGPCQIKAAPPLARLPRQAPMAEMSAAQPGISHSANFFSACHFPLETQCQTGRPHPTRIDRDGHVFGVVNPVAVAVRPAAYRRVVEAVEQVVDPCECGPFHAALGLELIVDHRVEQGPPAYPDQIHLVGKHAALCIHLGAERPGRGITVTRG